jgi:hypothetical protein
VSPPAWRKGDDRKAARDAYKREQYEAAKEAERRAEEARRKKEEEERK